MFFPFSLMMSFLVVMGSLISISSSSWLGIWGGLEMNMLCFIPLLTHVTNFQSVEASMKYFLIQSFGSVFFLFSGLMLDSFFFSFMYSCTFFFLIVSICLKLGVFPFHWWVPGVMGGLGWFGFLVLSTWQKLAPLFLFFTFSDFVYLLIFFGVFSSFFGGVGGLGQVSTRVLLAYSSIAHLGWMVSVGLCSFFFGVFYFFFYLLSSVYVILIFWSSDLIRVGQGFIVFEFLIFFVLVGLLSLGGFPPFSGFLVKLFSVFILMSFWGGGILVFFLLVGSLFSLYFYLMMFFSFLFFSFSYDGKIGSSSYYFFLLLCFVVFSVFFMDYVCLFV